ncbi:conserved hypothetical protein [Verticillium alfalfae VaMs.102]|uniref:Secreted protein n=1 Tax=Verticillium alfalfae (strain VaMs.102 / ATCC MYA-4576 / FGSC 10136) TaxID=526221 RepID=C9SY88_VERA1|nr:conserved hypothetical protein [Verticillium alfalfae VaMs.102]EEY23753.1 conserved hypothetical protein [Verticillium alfalfae VaMs.102]
MFAIKIMARFLVCLAVTVGFTDAYKFTFYGGLQCRGARLGEIIGGPGLGCRTDFRGVASAVIVESTGPVDDPFTVVLYSSNDCNPDTIIANGDEDDLCLTANFGSYEVWNLFD